MKTNRRSLFRALFVCFGFVSLTKGSGQSSSENPVRPTNLEAVSERSNEASTSIPSSDSTVRTVIHYDGFGRMVQRVDYYDDVPIVTSSYGYRHP